MCMHTHTHVYTRERAKHQITTNYLLSESGIFKHATYSAKILELYIFGNRKFSHHQYRVIYVCAYICVHVCIYNCVYVLLFIINNEMNRIENFR